MTAGGDEQQQDPPAAQIRTQTARIASGSATCWIQRGTTHGATPGAADHVVIGLVGPGGRARRRAPAARPPRPPRLPGVAARSRRSRSCARVCGVPDASASILFVGDVVGGLGRRALLGAASGAARGARADVRRRQRRELGGRPGDHAADRRRAVRGRRRRHHARQPHVPPPRDLPVSRRARRDPAPGQLPGQSARPRLVCRGARRRAARASSTCRATCSCAPGAPRSRRPTRCSSGSTAASTTCWSTCTPRRRARRSRSAGTSTAASRRSSGPTPTSRPPTAACCPSGTAYITDVGMTGPRGGVIGVKKEQAIESLRTMMSVRFETSEDDPWLNAVLVRSSRRMRADAIEQVLRPYAEPRR